jgi:hypothetical protein
MNPPATGAHHPWMPARRPGGRPPFAPRFRVLIHYQLHDVWERLRDRVGTASAQQFWDHVAVEPGRPPRINSATVLRGARGRPLESGFSRSIHYEVSGAARIDYQFNPRWIGPAGGDEYGIVVIVQITLGSH